MKNLINNIKDGKEKESRELTQEQFWKIINSDKFEEKIRKYTNATISDWWKSSVILSVGLAVLAVMAGISGFFFLSVLKLNEITVRTETNIQRLSEAVIHLEVEIQDKLSSLDREVIRLRDRLEK